jgi:hypothetical protein
MQSTHRGWLTAGWNREMEMTTKSNSYFEPVDVHGALARAHADRGEYIRLAIAGLPALVKRVSRKLRISRQRLPRNGAWA